METLKKATGSTKLKKVEEELKKVEVKPEEDSILDKNQNIVEEGND